MKFDKHKSFPYPVLRPGSDDYTECEFQGNVELKTDGDPTKDNVSFVFKCITSSEDLTDLISAGKASYLGVISCRETYLRCSKLSKSPCFDIAIPAASLHGEVKINYLIVATEPMNEFRPVDINEEYGDIKFKVPKGGVLAQDEPHIYYFDRQLFKPASSMFDIAIREGIKENQWRLDLDGDRVKILFSEKTKEKIDEARNSKLNRAVLINSVYFSAVLYCINVIQEDDGEYNRKQWYQVFRKVSERKGLDLDKGDPIMLAQELMDDPLRLLVDYVFDEVSR